MHEVYINVNDLPNWLRERKYFEGQDLFSVAELIGIIEDLDGELQELQEEYSNYKQYVNDNFKFTEVKEQIGWNGNW